MSEADDPPEESAAGPEARAAASRAMEAYEREHGHLPEDIMGDVMEAMMQQVYPEDGMQVRLGSPAYSVGLWLLGITINRKLFTPFS